MSQIESIAQRLDQQGYHLTSPRQIVVAAIASHAAPFTAAELLAELRSQTPPVGRATVFRTLDLLCRLQMVQRVHQDAADGRCHSYLACADGRQDHLICKRCGKTVEYGENGVIDRFVRAVEQRTGFRVEAHQLELLGLCAECQAASGSPNLIAPRA